MTRKLDDMREILAGAEEDLLRAREALKLAEEGFRYEQERFRNQLFTTMRIRERVQALEAKNVTA